MVFKKMQNKYIDRIYDQVSTLDGREGIEAPELYVAILLLYNNINKYTPGKWLNPPKKQEILKQMEIFDFNKDKVLNKQEFHAFCDLFLPDVTKKVVRNLLISVIILPILLGWAVSHLKFITKIIPDVVLSALFLALLNATGFMRVLDDRLDQLFTPKKKQYPAYAQAYPQGVPYPPPGQPVPQGVPYPYPPPGAVPGVPVQPVAPPATYTK